MNKTSLKAAAFAIAATSLYSTPAAANLSLDTTPITQEICLARFVRDPDPLIKAHVPHEPRVSTKLYSEDKQLSTDGWSRDMKKLLHAVNHTDLDKGTLSIIDCLGNSTTSDVRERLYHLDNFYRQRNETRGWRIGMEANDPSQQILRLLQLELPPSHKWEVNKNGDALIAQETIFHPRNRTNAVGWFNRIRVTEIKRMGRSLQVTQRFSTNDQFDELQTWTLNP